MTDFVNAEALVPERLNNFGHLYPALQGGFSQPWTAAHQYTINLAMFIPMVLPYRYPIGRVFWNCGSAQNAVDIGIYTVSGAKIFSTGSNAPGSTGLQLYSCGIILPAGRYFMAFASSGAFAQSGGGTVANGRVLGLYQQATAFPLPASATFAAWTTEGSCPFLGITTSTSGV